MSILFALIFSTFTAQAMPSIGDVANYNFVFNGKPGQLSQTITAFNSSTNAFVVMTMTTFGGQTRTEQQERDADELLTDAKVEAIMVNCAQYGGMLGTTSVPAGSFESCKLAQTQGTRTQTVYVSRQVTFGYVKLTDKDVGQNVDIQLVSYTRGQ
jgi:hypothetical protein